MADSLYINEQLQSQLVFLNFSSFLLLLSCFQSIFHILTNAVNKSVFLFDLPHIIYWKSLIWQHEEY